MKDSRGHYYYPFPRNKRVRMYVRQEDGVICFRMWSNEDPKMWEEHGWVPYGAIKEAATMYAVKKGGFDPGAAYDIRIAKALLGVEGER